MSCGKTALETLLTRRGFGPTLAAWRAVEGEDCTGIHRSGLDPRAGAITELVPEQGSATGGITSTAFRVAARQDGPIAWIDPEDRLDPASAARAGIALGQLLWLRGGGIPAALQAAQLILQAGGFSLVVVDFLDQGERMPDVPRSAWFRLLRALEREGQTKLLLLAPRPLAGTCADQVLAVGYAEVRWHVESRPMLDGARIGTRLASSRRDRPGSGGKHPPASAPRAHEEFVA